MAHRKLQKEVEAIFKKINEGIDLFDYYYSRHESSNNDSQREKLEGDLKKEIKKLQKFREQIKSWQSNESMEAIIAPNKLQEHRRMVEEAMETYKEVEKNSKMKSYSNQSIMLAAREQNDDLRGLSSETIDAIEYLESCVDSLKGQMSDLDEEYERLNEKKSRKTNYAAEERKQEIEGYNQKNNFHLSKVSSIIRLLKEKRIHPELVWTIQDDLNFYIESNQEPDFVDDDTFYDDLFKEVSNIPLDFKESEDDNEDDTLINTTINTTNTDTANSTANNISVQTNVAPNNEPVVNQVSSVISNTTPVKLTSSNMQKSVISQAKFDPTSVESSPAIIKTLKPAVAPPTPVGSIKWSVAAAAGSSSFNSGSESSLNGGEQKADTPARESPVKDENYANGLAKRSSSLKNSNGIATMTDANHKYVEVMRNSPLSKTEMELFSDLNLVKVPPGIQDLIISLASTRNKSSDSRLLTHTYDIYSTPISKPYLPEIVQSRDLSQRLPLQLLKLQSYWNKIRASNQFDQFVNEVLILRSQNNSENLAIVNELTMVLFYGYYYGLSPLENIIAESCLFKLSWKPYAAKNVELKDPLTIKKVRENGALPEVKHYYHWFNCIKVLPMPTQIDSSTDSAAYEFGDYNVFDLTLWEIYVKHGFKFAYNLCQLEPAKSI
ncbi:uncharacterized protein PRCAT00004956001 [Priceomyces carsonii]|uniref:uncharacterized protein n=1 Tax=Priceomyces carsonii TaxID=28549 RepID=UPI002ED885B0|nr:unnamed protein product [Priceomyces carsonii]